MIEKEPYIIEFSKIGMKEKGFLSFVEKSKLPFEIKRVYWIYNVPENIIRGFHSHKKLKQIIFAVNGSISFTIIDIFKKKYFFELNSSEKGLFIPQNYWREFKMSKDAVLLCLASEEYDENDYIRNIDDFLNQ